MDYNLKAAEAEASAQEAYHTIKSIEAAKVAAEDGLANLEGLPTLQDPAREAALEGAFQALEKAVADLGKVLEAGE